MAFYNEDKIILTDVDGVLLYWLHAFDYWASRKGYTKINDSEYDISAKYGISSEEGSMLSDQFNESAAIGWLPPYGDAIKYVRKLHEEEGYVFHCITALNDDIYVKKLRQMNLERIFGQSAIERIEHTNGSKNKGKYLSEYAGSGYFWIEDHVDNALMGLEYGLQPILMTHPYNNKDDHPDLSRVHSWREIYELII